MIVCLRTIWAGLIGALLAGIVLSVGLTTSNVDADIFNLWLEQDLLPKLPPGAVLPACVVPSVGFDVESDVTNT